ncbi:Hypothetical protein FKW44_014472 [Caligus rogercresseyi]|uniref:Uncharacterized protein n=1 Tax=Caligus rogercresseyi TaxID=217165 RepID=A0A7T8GYZ7_CALRO|nr:Hypothetical protein FKW44_014472 [Caligus rogercresseyi]
MAACFTKISFTDGRCDLSEGQPHATDLLFNSQQDTFEIVDASFASELVFAIIGV